MPILTNRCTTLTGVGLTGALVLLGASVALAQDGPLAGADGSGTSWDFEADDQGWVPFYVDLVEDYDPEVGDLLSEWSPLPEGLEGHGLYSQGANQSDDLFMGWKARVDGLEPETTYVVDAVMTMASNMPAEIALADNSPAEVYVKLGAYHEEPVPVVDDEGWLRLNADKGAEETGGKDAIVLGTIANSNLEMGEDFRTFALHDLTTEDKERELTGATDADGALWLFMGTDSGYAGFTTQFYDQLDVTLTPQ